MLNETLFFVISLKIIFNILFVRMVFLYVMKFDFFKYGSRLTVEFEIFACIKEMIQFREFPIITSTKSIFFEK